MGDLWSFYARHPYLPRLASFQVLAAAVSDGTAKLNWAAETFGYAAGRDGSGWRGVVTAEHVNPTPGGLIVHPDCVSSPPSEAAASDRGYGAAGTGGIGPGGGRPGLGPEAGLEPDSRPDHRAATRFYARFDLDPIRGIRQLSEILDHVTARLGPDLGLELEIRAVSAEGYDDATQRIVSENAANLGSRASEFE